MNRYDLEHVCTAHARMTPQDWQGIYTAAWSAYYSFAHIETLLRRAIADGIPVKRLMLSLLVFRGMPEIERVHPLQGGYVRLKRRRSRRPGLPREAALPFYAGRAKETVGKLVRLLLLLWRIDRIRRRVLREDPLRAYRDVAITPLPREQEERLEMMQVRVREDA